MKKKPERPIVTLLTDFGTSDHYVGAMKGVMLGICPLAHLVDISHEVTRYAIPEAAFTLAQAWQSFPCGSVHLVVVDPGVGSARRPILAEAAGHYFVAPDNGVLTLVCESMPTHSMWHITESRFFRNPVSRTFHGRDIFSPVAAHLASGVEPSEFGEKIEKYERLGLAKPGSAGPNAWSGTVLSVDRFGNVITNFDSKKFAPLLSGAFELRIGNSVVRRVAASYAEMEMGSLFVIAGSAGYLEISCNQNSAGLVARAAAGDKLLLRSMAS